MPSLRDQFQHFYMPDDDAIATAMQAGLVTPDTNVLLSLYRFQAGARDELFGALEKLGNRLWIPHQVGLEFHRNRLNVIAEQEAYFSKMEQEFNAAFDGLREKVRAFRARIAVDKGKIAQVEDSIQDLQKLLATVMNWASDGSLDMSDHASDAVLARLESLLGNRVGGPMEPKELEEAKKEAKRRADAGIPPGYKDKAKPDPTGDYLVWRQLMTESKDRNLPVVFVTDDRKEDWYRREHGMTLGARYELREEMMAEAGVPLLTMTTETFLLHAKNHLNAQVSAETVDQAKELPGQSQPATVQTLTPEQWVSLGPQVLAGMTDPGLERLRSGEYSESQMYFILGLLSARVGKEKAMQAVIAALNAAVASGDLPFERAVEATHVLIKFASMKADEPPAED